MSNTTKNNLSKELDYYIKNQNGLVQKYNGKYLIIKDEKVVGVYNTSTEAYVEGKQKFELGTFLIQLVSPGKEGYTQTFHSRAIF